MACARVMSSPGLLALIINEFERNDLPVPALVCRRWSSIARDAIWRHIENPLELFSLLAPLETVEGRLEFQRTPSYLDWQRFQPLARRVRSFTATLHASSSDTNIAHLLHVLKSTCPYESIFPHLEELVWHNHDEPDGYPELICVFLTATVKSLKIFTPTGSSRYSVEILSEDVAGRCPNLESLHIEPVNHAYATTLEPALIQLIQRLPLKSIRLPLYFLTPRVLAATSDCKDLQVIEVGVNRSDQSHNWSYARGFPDVLLHALSSSSLQSLGLAIPLMEMNALLVRDPSHLRFIHRLSVRAVGMTKRDVMRLFCETISKRCTHLRELLLVTNRPSRETRHSRWEKTPGSEAITLETLLPLSELGTLTYLELSHEHPVLLTDEELLALVTPLPRLEVLLMNECPANLTKPNLTMNCLPHLARALPNLRELGVCLDLSERVPDGPSPNRFQSLKLLCPHFSPVKKGHEEDVALFISTLLPLRGGIEDADAEDRPDRSFDVILTQPPTAGVWRKIRGHVDLIMRGREWNA
ncbi:unnamed protein product [Peniophora sp. CBMAI 1063]|nr:unnamed protein product [Peniophora sp. CBMAI 1063]